MAYPIHLVFVVALHSFILCGNLLQMIHAAQNPSGLSLRLIHRHSSESPVYRANLTDAEKMKELIQISNVRVKSLARSHVVRTKNSSSITISPPHHNLIVRPTIGTQPYYYFVKVGLGTFDSNPPYKDYYLAIDTGSDLIWTQCEGCESCFHQVDPYFPKSQSKTYTQFTNCRGCPPGNYCKDGNKCMIRREYADDAIVEALSSTETFTFESEGAALHKVTNTDFGCGLNMKNFQEDHVPNNKISGIFGMDYGGYSFVRQSSRFLLGRFSYCLQPTINHTGGSTMYLRFGDDIPSTQGMVTTPLIKVKDSNLYHLNLQDISVGKTRLNIPPEVFQVSQDSGGCVIDSGTMVSYLHPIAFKYFAQNAIIYMEQNPNVRKMEPEMGFQFCYERFQDPAEVSLPPVTFHFENADYFVEQEYVWFVGKNQAGRDMYCSEIYVNDEKETMIGALQQVNHRIIYDTFNGQLLFKPEDCSSTN